VSNADARAAQSRTGYCAYMIRLWQDSPYLPWRASAQSVQSREIVRFADVEQLFAFLRAQTTPPAAESPGLTADEPTAANTE
jgi:hypothetical protein